MIPYTPPSPPTVPVTTTCVMNAARTYQVPIHILVGVMAQENGKIGKKNGNSNHTYDHGPMQINTTWLSDLEKRGISTDEVTNNGCLNVYVGAAILRNKFNDAKGNWWKAIGIYHSKTPSKRDEYLANVVVKIKQIIDGRITLASILNKANGIS